VVGRANARLVPPGEPEALAAAIGELVAQPALREGMSEANRVRVKDFAWSSLVNRVRREYVAAIGHRAQLVAAAS
jgi:glycosyltransferase involved in cell wall biosynthesis